MNYGRLRLSYNKVIDLVNRGEDERGREHVKKKFLRAAEREHRAADEDDQKILERQKHSAHEAHDLEELVEAEIHEKRRPEEHEPAAE